MHLHLVIPGLLWPAKALHDCTHDLKLPALERLLGRGRLLWQEALPLENFLCRDFGIVEVAPVAPLRLLGEDIAPGEGVWLCADPCHFGFEQGRLILGSQALEITDTEMKSLLQTVEPLLAKIPGYLQVRAGAAGAAHAYLQLETKPELQTPPPSALRGFSLTSALPNGPEAQAWTRLGNELQMLLHAWPENKQREATGRPSVNSLWFWGAGRLPAAQPSPYRLVLGAEALLDGLVRWSGADQAALPAGGGELTITGSNLLFLPALAGPTQALDASLWRQALLELDRDWLAPITANFLSGRWKSLRISALGAEALLDIRLSSRDRFSFWRKPRALASLLPPEFQEHD